MFLGVLQKPKKGEVYNIGGTRFSNCSIIEALNYVEKKTKIKIKRIIRKENRVGDHIWYVSNMKKFKNIILSGNRNIIREKLLMNLLVTVIINFEPFCKYGLQKT